jgi:peroxiredoxin 2/4
MVKKVVLALFALSVVSGGILTANAENVGMEHNAQSGIPSRFARAEKTYALVGNPAPDFKLEGVVGTDPGKEFRTITLKDYKDKWLVLFFYPADFTFVCPTEIKGFNDSIDSFKKLNAEVAAVSTDSKWSHLAWIKRGDLGSLKYPLLSDFNKETARAYGVLDYEKGVALRGLFIIDPKGVIQYQVVHNLDVGRSVEETIRVLEALQSGGLCPLGWKPGQKNL